MLTTKIKARWLINIIWDKTHWGQGNLEWYIDGLVQGCSNSIANVLQLLQSCITPSISHPTNMLLLKLDDMALLYGSYNCVSGSIIHSTCIYIKHSTWIDNASWNTIITNLVILPKNIMWTLAYDTLLGVEGFSYVLFLFLFCLYVRKYMQTSCFVTILPISPFFLLNTAILYRRLLAINNFTCVLLRVHKRCFTIIVERMRHWSIKLGMYFSNCYGRRNACPVDFKEVNAS